MTALAPPTLRVVEMRALPTSGQIFRRGQVHVFFPNGTEFLTRWNPVTRGYRLFPEPEGLWLPLLVQHYYRPEG